MVVCCNNMSLDEFELDFLYMTFKDAVDAFKKHQIQLKRDEEPAVCWGICEPRLVKNTSQGMQFSLVEIFSMKLDMIFEECVDKKIGLSPKNYDIVLQIATRDLPVKVQDFVKTKLPVYFSRTERNTFVTIQNQAALLAGLNYVLDPKRRDSRNTTDFFNQLVDIRSHSKEKKGKVLALAVESIEMQSSQIASNISSAVNACLTFHLNETMLR